MTQFSRAAASPSSASIKRRVAELKRQEAKDLVASSYLYKRTTGENAADGDGYYTPGFVAYHDDYVARRRAPPKTASTANVAPATSRMAPLPKTPQIPTSDGGGGDDGGGGGTTIEATPPPAAPKKSNATLYVALGIGALVLKAIL